VPRLEPADRLGERLVELGRVESVSGELARRRQAAAHSQHARVPRADLEGLAGRNWLPAPLRGQGSVLGERGARSLVPPVVGTHGRDRLRDPAARQRVEDEGDAGGVLDRPRLEIPLGVERLRVHLAQVEVVEQQVEAVRRQQVELRARSDVQRRIREARREPRELGGVIVLRQEAVGLGFPHEPDECLEALGRPERLVTGLLVEERQRDAGLELRAADLESPRRLELLQALAQRVGHGGRGGITRRDAGGGRESERGCYGPGQEPGDEPARAGAEGAPH
jgi:hypothetical protein